MLECGYIRSTGITKDIDLSTIRSLDVVFNEIVEATPGLRHEIYQYKISGTKKIAIDVANYGGQRIKIEATVNGIKTRANFHIDLSVEELKTIVPKNKDGLKIYSVERSLADKFVTFIQRGEHNSRSKDFIDYKSLYDNCDKQFLSMVVRKLIIVRNVNASTIEDFKNNYASLEFVKQFKVEKEISEFLEILKI